MLPRQLGSVRRARSLVCYWDGAKLIITNYRTRAAVTATPVTILLLNLLSEWSSPTQVARLLPRFKPRTVFSTMRQLLRCGLLVQKDTAAAAEDQALHKTWSAWLPHAGCFHFSTKDVPYESRPRELLKIERRMLQANPQPPFYKNYRGSLKLHLQQPNPESEFAQILMRRRTHRQFSRKELPLQALSNLLFYTWGVTGFLQLSILGELPLKTSPSAGARHPIEVYVLGMRIKGVRPGLYHYQPRTHCLEKLRGLKDAPIRAARFCVGQRWAKEAAALFIMTAVFSRAMWKYPTSRAYRTVLLDAGHVCQTFCLVATWLGLAPFCTMALRDSLIEKELRIDGFAESVIYIAGVGMPARDSTTSKRRSLSLASL
jgi:SagB-type dehydrogenase family enzyme